MSQGESKLEEHWRAIGEYAARENDRQKLTELVVKVNHLMDIVERRMAELDDSTSDQ